MKIVHIVPALPPVIDGVADFALILGNRLAGSFDLENTFTTGRQPAHLESADYLLLHYSGYGYDSRGTPRWLVESLERLAGRKATRLAVFFHELWVQTAPWRTPFYYAFAQKRMVRRLQKIATVAFTSTPRMKRLLDEGGGSSILVPIPSTLPVAPRAKEKSPALNIIVFGQEHTRKRSVRAHLPLLGFLSRSGRLAKLSLIGKGATNGSRDYQAATLAVPTEFIDARADLAAGEIAQELANADLALSFYPLDYLTKSTTIMAAFAHGCPVVLPDQRAREPFRPAPPVLFCDGSEMAINDVTQSEVLLRAGEASRLWYQEHAGWGQAIEKIGHALALGTESVGAAAG